MDELSRARFYQDARAHRNAYFEKLALLDGGTVALVITAVLGPLHAHVSHKYLMGAGLSILVLSMLILLRRNYLAVQLEFYGAANATGNPDFLDNPQAQRHRVELDEQIHYSEVVGILMTSLGLVLLLAEVWLILI